MRKTGKDIESKIPRVWATARDHPALAWPSCQMRAYDVLLPRTPMAQGRSVWAADALTVNRSLPHK